MMDGWEYVCKDRSGMSSQHRARYGLVCAISVKGTTYGAAQYFLDTQKQHAPDNCFPMWLKSKEEHTPVAQTHVSKPAHAPDHSRDRRPSKRQYCQSVANGSVGGVMCGLRSKHYTKTCTLLLHVDTYGWRQKAKA